MSTKIDNGTLLGTIRISDMIVKDIIHEDFINYKKPCMIVAFPYCSFKCEKECGVRCCQNNALAQSPNIKVSYDYIVESYINNPITKAICFQGLEPFDSWCEMYELICRIREKTNDTVVIYTGYYEYEIEDFIEQLKPLKNIILKTGRFIPNQSPHYDEILGVNLASDNQKGVRIC